MLQEFYRWSQKETVTRLRTFLEEDFFGSFPKWKDKIAVIVTGSVANGRYDQWSDIDVTPIIPKKLVKAYSKDEIKQYKKRIQSAGEPIQLHAPKTLEEIAEPLDWAFDGQLRERSRALIIVDAGGAFKRIQKQTRYYPAAVRKDKIEWLIGEAVFSFHDRFKIAERRADSLFGEMVKTEIIRLLLNACLLASKEFPAFDKHVYFEVKAIPSIPSTIIETVDSLVAEHAFAKVSPLLEALMDKVTAYCVKTKTIKSQPREYWLNVRPQHQVSFK